MRLALVALAIAAAVLLVPIIAIAQAISYGWGYVFNTAYMGVQRAMWSYGMPGSVPGMGGMMGWGSSYMGRMASMGGMMGHHMGDMGMGMGSPPHSGGGEEHDHMEACARLMALPHVVVSSISFNGYTAMPSS